MVSKRFIDMTVDSDSLSHRKKVWNNTTGTGTPTTYLKYIYDGWNLIAELNGNSSNAKVRTYTWGLDVSGSTTEAGGVGGLLMVDDASNGVHFVSYDLNGNVMGMVKATNGTVSAVYEYGPFGELLSTTGTMASSNPFRFSTKYRDTETDLYYYGYRYYSPSLGRWISRDPIDEQGGLNLYAFVNNDPVNYIDTLGNIENIIFEVKEYLKISKGIDKIYHQLLQYEAKVSITGFSNSKLWGGFAASTFLQLWAQAIYDEIQSRLEQVIRDKALCYRVNIEYAINQEEYGEFDGKEYSFPSTSKPWTWSRKTTPKQTMYYEPCPNNPCMWHVYYYVSDSQNFKSPIKKDRFKCSGKPRCRRKYSP